MCLSLKIKLSEQDSVHSDEIANLASKMADMDIRREKSLSEIRLFGKKTCVLLISEWDKGCACSLLTDHADWNAATWDMKESNLPKIAKSLSELRKQTQSGFSFEALWQGEKPTEERELSIDDLATIIESGKIGTKTKYLVV